MANAPFRAHVSEYLRRLNAASRYVRTSACGIVRFTWCWRSTWKDRRRGFACGSPKLREPAFWLSVLTEVQNRGVKDFFIACVDGLTGLPEAIETVYPQTRVQLCMVHLVRNSLRYVSYKHMRIGGDRSQSDLLGQHRERSRVQFGTEGPRNGMRSIPAKAASWRAHWTRVIPLFAFSEDIRRIIYTTNAIESVNMTLRHP
jgi:transposase-like protein